MSGKWDCMKFGDLFDYENKSKIKAGDGLSKGIYPFYTSSVELTKFRNQFQFDNTSLIFGTGGNASIHYVDSPFSVSTDCLVAFAKDTVKVYPKFVYYYISGNINLLEEGFKGAGLKHISKGYINEILIPLPPLATQKRIAEILDAADALRRKDQELLKKYDELVQAIFIDMFGDPVKNEKGWEVRKLQDVVHPDRIVTYGIVQAGEHLHDGVPYIKTGDIKDGEILIDQLQRTSNEIANSYRRSQLYKGDIVMSIRATVGTVALLPDSLIGANLTQGTARISPSDNINRLFLYYYLKNEFAQNWISSNAKGATFREITLTKLRELPILFPPQKMQLNFSNRIESIHKGKLNSKSSSKKSRLLFESLIQKAFKGELVS
jgi:type I restriction enzyme S subunit